MSKYVFVVHSSITYRMAGAIRQLHSYAPEDCIYLIDRGFELPISDTKVLHISHLPISTYSWKEKMQLVRALRTNTRRRQQLQQLLETAVGGPFMLFIPHTWSYVHWILLAHNLCFRYFLVEEGTLSYLQDFSNYGRGASPIKEGLLQLLVRISLGNGIPAFPAPLEFHHPKYAGCYGISRATFPTLPEQGKILLTAPFNGNEVYAAVQHLLITGPWVERNFISLAGYRELKTGLFKYLVENGIDQIHVKFHPDQYHQKETIQVFREIADQFHAQIAVIELPADVAPEEIAFSSKADVYMAISSVAIYARLFGCRVFSYAEAMAARWDSFDRFYRQMPAEVVQGLIPLPISLDEPSNKSYA